VIAGRLTEASVPEAGEGKEIEDMSELKRTQNRRRTRATSEIAVRDVAAAVLEEHFQQAGKGTKMRR
jgi:hypothetical protein